MRPPQGFGVGHGLIGHEEVDENEEPQHQHMHHGHDVSESAFHELGADECPHSGGEEDQCVEEPEKHHVRLQLQQPRRELHTRPDINPRGC